MLHVQTEATKTVEESEGDGADADTKEQANQISRTATDCKGDKNIDS